MRILINKYQLFYKTPQVLHMIHNNIKNTSKPILNKQKICKAYYPYPEYKLKILINSLLKKHNLSIYSHNITNKIWYELVEEMGEPN